ncbi:MAG TPA: efflux RND transporter periplasmic adaptor subunit [Caulobacteraceae bacterium]
MTTAVASPSGPAGAPSGSVLLDASGYVVARREATVSAKVVGKVARVLIEEGQHVAAGQELASLDDSNARAALEQAVAQANTAQANVELARANLGQATSRYGRVRDLPRGVMSDELVETYRTAAETARDSLLVAQRQAIEAQANVGVFRRAEDDTVLRAPFSGVVTATTADPGEIVAPVAGGGFTRTGICTIVDMDSLEVDVDVSESFISRVAPGMPARVKLDAYPDWEIPAQVITVIPTADRAKATVTVRVGLKLKDPRIVPEMGAHVAFLGVQQQSAAPAARAVVVPPAAVQTEEGGQSVVFVITGGRAQRRAVRLGERNAAGQLVLAGLQLGDVVAAQGADHLKDGASVKVANQKRGEDNP